MKDNVTRYNKLKAEIEELKKFADTQSHHYKKSREMLYEGLSRVYLFWREASKEEVNLPGFVGG